MKGGRTIEVLLFAPASSVREEVVSGSSSAPPGGSPSAATALPAEPGRLHVCPHCDSTLVYPTGWEERGADHWSIDLRCPSCEWRHNGVFSQGLANSFDEELERGTRALARDLDRLSKANMVEAVERFTEALKADAVQPMDF